MRPARVTAKQRQKEKIKTGTMQEGKKVRPPSARYLSIPFPSPVPQTPQQASCNQYIRKTPPMGFVDACSDSTPISPSMADIDGHMA